VNPTFYTSLGHWAAVGGIVFLGQLSYATLGFGAGMISITLLVLIYGNTKFVVPFYILVCLPTEIAIAYRDREAIDVGRSLKIMGFIIPTLFLGTLVLDRVASVLIDASLGGVIALLALYFLVWEDQGQEIVVREQGLAGLNITRKIYEISWGYKKINDTHFFVTSGIQLWGPPVRTVGKSEIMVIDVELNN